VEMLQKKVEESLQKVALQVSEMFLDQPDLISVLHMLDASIKHSEENDAYLTAKARHYKSQLHMWRSYCLCGLVR